jgi:hypothetical protein
LPNHARNRGTPGTQRDPQTGTETITWAVIKALGAIELRPGI